MVLLILVRRREVFCVHAMITSHLMQMTPKCTCELNLVTLFQQMSFSLVRSTRQNKHFFFK